MAIFKGENHRRIEKFGITFTVLSTVMASLIAFGLYSSSVKYSNLIGDKSIYTSNFELSRTKNKGTLVNIYRSSDNKAAFVLFKFNDPAKVSLEAGKYQFFLRAANVKGNEPYLDPSIKGSIYMFGSTGYGGIYLVNADGFENKQVLEGILRSNSELVSDDLDSLEKKVEDGELSKGFLKYDQTRFVFNPGAKSSEVSSLLNDKDITAGELYKNFVATIQDAEARDQLNSDLRQMKDLLSKIAEYRSRLANIVFDSAQIVIPPEPKAIEGDKVVGDKVLKFEPKYIYPAGFNFDYNKYTLNTGYLKYLVPEGQDYNEYLTKVLTVPQEAMVNNKNELINDNWMFTNGKSFNDYLAVLDKDTILKGIIQTSNMLDTAYSDYMSLKRNYQIQDLRNLLNVERDIDFVSKNSTVNDSSKAVEIFSSNK